MVVRVALGLATAGLAAAVAVVFVALVLVVAVAVEVLAAPVFAAALARVIRFGGLEASILVVAVVDRRRCCVSTRGILPSVLVEKCYKQG